MRSRRAFTVIEMMVVVGVIAVLICLLLPALRQGRHQARRVACFSNMHQQHVALFQFASDRNAKFPHRGEDPSCGP